MGRRKSRIQLILLILFISINMYLFYQLNIIELTKQLFHRPNPDVWCFDQQFPSKPNALPEFNTLNSTKPPIFFVETNCASCKAGHIILSARQACAIESAAKMNPNSNIYILFVSYTTLNTTSEYIQQLFTYPNIYFKYIYLPRLLENTPLEGWYRSKVLHYSVYARSHTSDLLRYLILWKFGGTYLDLDVIVTTPIEELEPNYAGAEDDEDVDAGIINFERGFSLAEQAVIDLRDHYNPNDWGSNGPGVITRLLYKTCGVKNTTQMSRERCKGFKVYEPAAFYAIYWRKWQYFFDPVFTKVALNMLKESKMIHVWNNFSKNTILKVGANVAYGKYAEMYCPKVYSNCGLNF